MRLFSVFFAIMLLFGYSGCSDSKNGSKSADKPSFRVGLSADYPPFEMKKDDKIVGFDVDLLELVSKKAGFDYTLINTSFEGLISALKANKIDMIISSMSATEEREKAVDFSVPYYEGVNTYIKQKNNKKIVNKDSIKGKRVGVYIGTVQEIAVDKMKKKYNLTVMKSDNIATVIMNLKTNKVDFALADDATAVGYLKENPELVDFYRESDGSKGLSIAMDKGKNKEIMEKINKAIEEIKSGKEYQDLLDKYGLKLVNMNK